MRSDPGYKDICLGAKPKEAAKTLASPLYLRIGRSGRSIEHQDLSGFALQRASRRSLIIHVFLYIFQGNVLSFLDHDISTIIHCYVLSVLRAAIMRNHPSSWSRVVPNSTYAPPTSDIRRLSTSNSTTTHAKPLKPLSLPPNKERERCDGRCEESLQARVERLGRERPPTFKTLGSEIIFVFTISMSQFLTEYFVSGFPVLLPTLIRKLDIPQATSVWPATAFSLVIASTLLVFGRLGDMWGGYPIFLCGLAWLLVWCVIAGFSVNPLMLDICRALQGLGAAAFLPTGVMLMGSLYRPGPRKNLVFAIYGTSGVFGFFGGIFVAGLVGSFLRWGFYFWIGAILTAITVTTSIWWVPYSRLPKLNPNGIKMDYPGAFAIITGLTLTVFAITQSAHAPSGWGTPYIPTCFVLGVLSLLSAAYIEIRISSHPLLPASVFTTSSMTPLLLALFLLYGTWGIFSVY